MNVQRIIVVLFLLLILGIIMDIIILPASLTYLITKEWGPVENVQADAALTAKLLCALIVISIIILLKNPFEELLELAIPFFFLNALLLYGNQTKESACIGNQNE